MNQADLKKILDAHAEWARGTEGAERAYLSGANLSGANLSGAYLSGAYLSDANLSDANLSDANLSGANLSDANLSDANLSRAYLSDANLSRANLSRAYLSDANLSRANLSDANLSDATTDDETQWPAFWHCPEVGAFTAWKKLRNGIIAELLIPAEAKRTSSLVGRKCRADFAQVVALHAPDGSHPTEGKSQHDPRFTYVVGEIARPDSYDDDIKLECTNGLHFFITRAEAAAY